MERLICYISILFSFVALSSCGDKDEPGPVLTETDRTVLVYMVADNSLGTWSCDDADIAEMLTAAKAGGLAGGRLVVYHGRPRTEINPPQLLDITPSGVVTLKTYPTATADGDKIYSVDPARIREVLSDTKTFAPAGEYAIVFWSHSSGWLGPVGKDDYRYRAFGDDRGHHITIQTLASTLAGEKFSFIYFDCCQMANEESAYELRHLTPVIVGSPTELGIDGMRYDLNVPVFFSPVPDLEQAARNTYEDYAGNNLECQMTVIRTEGLERLASATRDIMVRLEDYPEGVGSLQRYCRPTETCWSYDMKQYMELITPQDSKELLAEWEKAFDKVVTYAASTPTAIGGSALSPFYINTCNGLGMYVIKGPEEISYRQYDSLAWWNDVVSVAPAYK